MPKVALIDPLTLLGQEVRERWSPAIPPDYELLCQDSVDDGAVTELFDNPALVNLVADDSFTGVDVAIFCGPTAEQETLAALPSATKVIFADPLAAPVASLAVLQSIASPTATKTRYFVNPVPSATLLAYLLEPLGSLGLERVTAHTIEPVSTYGKQGIDALFEQTRSLLTMSTPTPTEVLDFQIAFNCVPVERTQQPVSKSIGVLTGLSIPIRVHRLLAGVFHGTSASVLLEFDRPVDIPEFAEAYSGVPTLELVDDSLHSGPVSIAGNEKIHIDLAQEPENPRSVWAWALMDNLLHSAQNVVSLAESFLAEL